MADELKKQLLRNILTITFQKNLLFFKSQFPHLYEKFKEYQPTTFGLELDENGNLNIGGPSGWMYKGSPQQMSVEQARNFIHSPVRSLYRLPALTDEELDEQNPIGFRHMYYLRDVASAGRTHVISAADQPFEPVGRYAMLSVIGIGLGYHLDEIATVKIDHLYLYEPNDDVFFASMHTLDYEILCHNYIDDGRAITVLVGEEPDKYVDGFLKLLHKNGQFRAGILPVYKHYDHPKTDDALGLYFKNLSYVYGGFGFTEDEFISLKHTSENIHKDRNFLLCDRKFKHGKDIPVFIVGAGPSLDNDIDVIIANQDKALIVSCGSSLAALHRYGVVPDYHIEIERTEPVYDWLKLIDDEEYLKKITMVCMQTIFPAAIDMFGDNILFLKPNDGGTDLLRVTYGKNLLIEQVYGTNPTVVNGAYGFFEHMDCGEIYLFGADMGYKDPSKHHSSKTGYYSKFKDMFDDFDTSISRPGNFDENEKIYSNHTFDWARTSLEYRLRNLLKEGRKVFNCSDGAKITGAVALRSADIALETVLDKSALKAELKSYCAPNPFRISDWDQSLAVRGREAVKLFNELIDERFLTADYRSNNVIDIFIHQHRTLFSHDGTKEIFAMRLIKGSMTYMQTTILGLIYCINTEAERVQFVREALRIYYDYLIELRDMFIAQFGPFAEEEPS